MIDLYSWGTPNGRKVNNMHEENGLEYTLHQANISKNNQFKREFLDISPNDKIREMVCGDTGQTLLTPAAIYT